MAKSQPYTWRGMGDRTVRLTFTFSVSGTKNVTDRAWTDIQNQIDKFVDDIQKSTILRRPVIQEATYLRQVEVREPVTYE